MNFIFGTVYEIVDFILILVTYQTTGNEKISTPAFKMLCSFP